MTSHIRAVLLLTLIGALGATAAGDILVYDGFATPGDYTNGYDLATQTGGGSGDWTGDWIDVQSNAAGSSVSSSLTDDPLLNEAGSMSSPSSFRLHYVRQFTNDPNLFAADGEVWFSVLFSRSTATKNMGITIAASSSEYIGCGFRIDNGSTLVKASINGTLGQDGVTIGSGDTVLVVGRVSIDAGDTSGDHVVDIWVNPNPQTDLSTASLKSGDSFVDRSYASFESSDRINIYSHQDNAVVYDEIRIGATYADVVPINHAPTVDAGEDAAVMLPASANLDGTVSDDGTPGAVTTLWTKESGPGTVTFGDEEAVDTTASFSAAGMYVLRLTADDGEFEVYDEVTITATSEGILTPSGAGGATGSAYFPMGDAFDGQPTWDAQNGEPSGGGGTADAPYYSDRHGYIDFGTNWQDVRITGTWTLYRSSSSGDQTPYVDAFWDNDTDNTNDDGVTETVLNFNSAQDLNTGGTTPWIQDVEAATAPVRPQRQYLIMHSPSPMTGRAKEYAIVGYVYTGNNTAPSVSAGDNQTISLADSASLDGTVTDDDLPDPPGAVTVTWTKQSGPGAVNFGDDEAVDTTATFGTEGTYLLRLTADDGEAVTYDEVLIVVNPAPPVLTLAEPQVFDFQSLTLVDEVLCADPQETHTLYESSQGISSTETILNAGCRVLPNDATQPTYFGYVLGASSGLVAGKAYVLVVEYPEDQPRSMVVVNHGCETNRGFHTGTTVGDCLTPIYTGSNPESLNYGFTQNYRSWQQLFHLHDRFPDIQKPRDSGYREYLPNDGFYVLISQYASEEDPTSAGAAVKRIALYEAPSLVNYTQELAELPEGLPKRHLFWREEMADGVIKGTDPEDRGVTDDVDWYEYKARLEKFLGMNTFCKDLLEFGHPQGWDVSLYGGHGSDWFNRSSTPFRWEKILIMLANGGYDLDVLPYYEYAGGDGIGDAALGKKKRCIPLARTDGYYTHIAWAEALNIDVSDPDAVTDATRLLQETITALHEGNRPVPLDVSGNANATWKEGEWGYIDFGEDWDEVRICQTWTRSRIFNGGDASPFSMVYWNADTSGFSGDTVPQGAIEETTINFLTQEQINGASRWRKDVDVAGSPITPQAQYLVMRAADPLTDCQEFLIVGYIDGEGTDLKTISVTGSTTGYPMQNMFDNQPAFNLEGVNFVGAWFRPRVTAIPMGFAEDSTLVRFSNDLQISPTVERTDLIADADLLDDYYDWWFDQRKAYLNTLRDYLRTNVNEDAVIMYTWDHTESGVTHPTVAVAPDVVTDDVDTWNWLVADPMLYDDAVSSELHYEAMTLPAYNWSEWEWPHAIPRGDGPNYQGNEGVMMEYVFNKLYTVTDPDWFDEYRTQSGLTCIRHYCLNEDCMRDDSDPQNPVDILGYFVADMEVAGPYCMLPEARAVANGNPYYFGYLSANSFNRGFPGYAREFNANFLALPALPMTTETGAASSNDVVVRSISTQNDGMWLAIVNVGLEDQEDVVVTLPVAGTVTDAVTGSSISVSNGTITLDLWPGQLKSIHIDN